MDDSGAVTVSGDDTLARIIDRQRTAWRDGGIVDAATRRSRVDAMIDLLTTHSAELEAAVSEDFGRRPAALTRFTDIGGSVLELGHQRTGVRHWAVDRRVGRWSSLLGVTQSLRRDPLGVVGVIGAWNFPVHLSLTPAGSALAAGNHVVVKPPPETPETSRLLATLMPTYFDLDVLTVVEETQVTGEEFSRGRFDHLFFTGSPRVGALVGSAAAANLVPTTLELGGRNPVFVDRGVNPARTARFLADARMANGGQVCICPDYALVPVEDLERVEQAVLARWADTLPTVASNPAYTSIISERHFDRIVGLIDDARERGARVTSHRPAGEVLPDRATRIIPPTVVVDPSAEAEILGQEVFGPVLTLIGYSDLDEAIDYVASRPSPLVLYWCGDDGPRRRAVVEGTRSGAVNCNDLASHLLSPSMPFGGVGTSGNGRYHGEFGFDTFTHLRPVMSSRVPVRVATAMGHPDSRTGRVIDTGVRGVSAALRVPARRRHRG